MLIRISTLRKKCFCCWNVEFFPCFAVLFFCANLLKQILLFFCLPQNFWHIEEPPVILPVQPSRSSAVPHARGGAVLRTQPAGPPQSHQATQAGAFALRLAFFPACNNVIAQIETGFVFRLTGKKTPENSSSCFHFYL